MHNIGILFVQMGRYKDAITSFEYCMHDKASFRTGVSCVRLYSPAARTLSWGSVYTVIVPIAYPAQLGDEREHVFNCLPIACLQLLLTNG